MVGRSAFSLTTTFPIFLLFLTARAEAENPELKAHYVFDGDFQNVLGPPPLVPIGIGQKFPQDTVSCSGTKNDTVLELPSGTGIELPANVLPIPKDDYTVVLIFKSETSGRILNFDKSGEDANSGLYAFSGSRLSFSGSQTADGNFPFGIYVRLIFTREASTKNVDCYLDNCSGSGPKLQISFVDTKDLAVIDKSLKFFKDDTNEDMKARVSELFLYSGGLGRLQFLRGDSDGNCLFNNTDPIVILNHLFLGAPAPPCEDAADVNDDGELNLTDPIYLLNWLFRSGPQPKGPLCQPACQKDIDYTVDSLDCKSPCTQG